MARTMVTPRNVAKPPRKVYATKKTAGRLISKGVNLGKAPRGAILGKLPTVNKPAKCSDQRKQAAKTVQKKGKADAALKKNEKLVEEPPKKVLSGVKSYLALIKDEAPKLNDCCKFCNNRLVTKAAQKGDVAEIKKLLADFDNITNPF